VFLRFAIDERDSDSGRGLGIFHAAGRLRDEGDLEHWEREILYDTRDWFNDHLEKPTRFTASKPPYYRKQPKAIAWFKDTATDHLERIHQMIAVLERHGVIVRTYRTERVGYVVYEDQFQIVAEPLSDIQC
jgi:hypothetical protein